jgi:nucleotide-binding universal stress UspA family protein
MQRFKDILCVVELGKIWKSALERAVSLAENNQANLNVIAVAPSYTFGISIPEGGPISADLQAATLNRYKQELVKIVEPYFKRIKIDTNVLVGTPFLEIIREVLRNEHDLVIKCPESPDWLNRFFAGDDMHLLRKCPCPIWMVKSESREAYQCVLAAVDVDDNYLPAELETRQALNNMVMEIAGALAFSEFAELHVVHAWEAIGESAMRHGAFLSQPEEDINTYVEKIRSHHARRLDELMRETGAKLGSDAMDYLKPQLHLLKGSARKEIPVLAKQLQVDCIVMGTVARTGIRGFIMGNTAETILGQIDCSVLAIKPPGFVTPVMLED